MKSKKNSTTNRLFFDTTPQTREREGAVSKQNTIANATINIIMRLYSRENALLRSNKAVPCLSVEKHFYGCQTDT